MRIVRLLPVLALVLVFTPFPDGRTLTAEPTAAELNTEYTKDIRPLLQKYCLSCHSTKLKKGSLDLERFAGTDDIRKDVKPWQGMIEQIEAGEMPPKDRPQPSAEEKKKLIGWVKNFLDAEARANVGDPGHVPLRRLSNAEYDYTIRDLTGVDLRPTREFPADGAAGEGFTNAAEALTDISPALLTKYLNAAKEIADHAVFLPDGFRFSKGKTRRDWTDEQTAKLRAFYGAFSADGKLNVLPYLTATVKHRDAVLSGQKTIAAVAAAEKLNPKYLDILWETLTTRKAGFPLETLSAKWATATEKDVPALAAEIAAWQTALWKFQIIGSYRYGAVERQVAQEPAISDVQTLRFSLKPEPGQSEVTLHLAARDVLPDGKGGVVWQRPRFEAPGQPTLLLQDYAKYGPAREVDFSVLFDKTDRYLTAAADPKANRDGLDPAFLQRWTEALALQTDNPAAGFSKPLRVIPAGPISVLDDALPKDPNQAAINGWKKKGTDLPVAVSNSSAAAIRIPGTVQAHGIGVHPTPQEYVAAAWTSPSDTAVSLTATVTHAHAACGNGIGYRIEHRRGNSASVLAEEAIPYGKEVKTPAYTAKVAKGDILLLVVEAKTDHTCDMTGLVFTIQETAEPKRTWDLAKDVADSILDGNPHADSHGNNSVWSFVRGASIPAAKAGPLVPPESTLGRWKTAILSKKPDAATLAEQVRKLLTGPRPSTGADRTLFDNLVSFDSVLLAGLDLAKLGQPKGEFGLPVGQFKDSNLAAEAGQTLAIRLPAALFRDHTFVVDGKLGAASDSRLVQFQIATASPVTWDARGPVVAQPNGTAHKRLLAGFAEHRRLFPPFLCFTQVIPTDEVVSLKMFHREDEPLRRLFLDPKQTAELEHLWLEHRFISRQAVAENDYLPQFIGYVTQDQPKELLNYFESQRPVFQKRAEDFVRDETAAQPRHLEALITFAARAYRRPLTASEKEELQALYRGIRQKGTTHEEAFRGVLARIFVAPAFLFRIEAAPAGKAPANVSEVELASRLSYFLWSSLPDEELMSLAVAGKLRASLPAQVTRMLKDPRSRALAVEFGTQWLHVRGFEEFNEKNEKLFPTFNAELRAAMNEEAVQFFRDFFTNDRSISSVLDADHVFVNDLLARHYGIPNVAGPEFRRVDGARKYGRGGILGFASVQSKQSGASRTSPVLRGNWVVETLLGEKLPKPPPNVPQLPAEEGADKLTTRQQVEKHAKDPACAVCHVRIDPFGFALEKFDAIGRFREKDLGGLAVDTRVKLKDATEFEGIEGLRNYLVTKKKDVIERLFCKRLLGYALGRAVTLSDTVLLDEMTAALKTNGGRVSAAIHVIVMSPQFQKVRGRDFE